MSAVLLMVALAAATATPEDARPEPAAKPVPAMVREILADKQFEFCHNPKYPLISDERELCKLIVASDMTCPALDAACKHGRGATKLESAPRKRSFQLPEIGGVGRFLLYALLGLGIGAVVFVLLRNVRPWQRQPKVPEEPEPVPATALVEALSPVETDVERLLARARAAAAAGDYGRAIIEVHAALLRRLEGAGLVSVHPSRTNGDYVRAVAGARPGLAAPVRSFVVDVERVQYGQGTASAELFQALLARLAAVSPDKLLALALVGALALGATSCRDERGNWEHSPSGRAGAVSLLKRAGRQVRERFVPVSKLEADTADALVVLPEAELSDEDWARLETWVNEDGGRLVLASMPRKRPDWVGGQDATQPSEAVHVVATRQFKEQHGPLDLPLPPSLPVRVGSSYEPLLVRGAQGSVYAAERSLGEGSVLALADDRLLTNGALPFGDNARALVLLFSGTPRIELVGELTGFVSPNPIASVTRGGMGPFLIQLLVLSAIFFLSRGVAFGRLREPPAVQRRSFNEHIEALGEQYARARAARHVLASYGHWVIERLRERVALPAGSGLIALADAVAVRTGKPAGEVMRLMMEAREVAAPAAPGTAEEVAAHLAAVRALGELLSLRGKTDGGAPPSRPPPAADRGGRNS